MKLKIFFSWQVTTNIEYNKKFIRSCIDKSVEELKNIPVLSNVEFEIQEGTAGLPGSVGVASKITDERIPNCDIFIADISVVNHINKFKKFIRFITGDKYKPFQNNNVFYEYGVAYESIGVEKIIGVLNNAYGSPNDNSDNIPFDIRHLRFPIEYKYSSKNHNIEKVRNDLVVKLTQSITETAIFALQNQKEKYKPLSVWNDWEMYTNTNQKYYENDIITGIKNQILEAIKKPNESIRLIGLSGLGKTRILFELFRVNNTEESIDLNSRVLYLNCNHYSNIDYHTIFTNLTKEKENRIVILDNCIPETHRQLLQFVNNENNLISLITIDSNPEEIEQNKINGVNYILIKKEDLTSVVSQILTDDFSNLKDDEIEKIKEFSQGIPLMAVLIGESIKKGEKFIGKLDDKDLLDKLLGDKGTNERYRTILKSCSIFSYFGIEDELSSQLDFIATDKNITSLTGENQVIINEFRETCSHFLKREIFERKGRLIGLRPLPLAMSLTQEWLDPCTPERLYNIITSISNLDEPHRNHLTDAMAEQMKNLGYNENAVLIIEKIVGSGSPFDNAEVLNTEMGSRFFRSFVEVNPIAVSKNLTRNLTNKTKDDILNIKNGRRNLVWVLEKLCFDKRTFIESAKILCSFSISENETWSNNATGQFLHLFKIFLAGTEANLKQRWEIIEWALNKDNQEYYSLAINAMKSGLDYGHFSRMSGSENQGSKKLIDYQPNWDEIREYWTNIILKLTLIIKSDNDNYSELASLTIANSIRSMFNAGFGHVMIPFIEEISIFKKNDWDKGLKELKSAKKYEKGKLSKDLLERVDNIINTLTKTDFKTRYLSISDSYYLDNDEIYSYDKMIESVIKLADEFIFERISWESHFQIFYTNNQVNSYQFGKRIYELINDSPKKVDEFIELSIRTLSDLKKEERNVAILGGVILESNDDVKNRFYNFLSQDNHLNYLLFYFISNDTNGKKYFNLLYNLVDKDLSYLENFKQFTYSNSLRNCDEEDLIMFSKKLFSYGEDGYVILFEIYFNLGYDNEELKLSLIPIFKECIYNLGAIIQKRNIDYKWSQTICSILASTEESEFAKFVNNTIIESITWQNTYHLDNYIQSIYEVLIKIHFDAIWYDLSKAIIGNDEEYSKFYGLKHILKSNIGGIGRSIGILFDGDLNIIFKWCKENEPLAPTRLAELVPIFGDNNNNYSEWHPISKKLIDEFGNNIEVLRHLSSNMGTYSWTGSVVPLLEAKKELFKSIENHNINLVAEWASQYLAVADEQIRQEKNRDEERYYR